MFESYQPDCLVTTLNGISCPNGVCPCSVRRRLLQQSTSMGLSVAVNGAAAPVPDMSKTQSFVVGITVFTPESGSTTPVPTTAPVIQPPAPTPSPPSESSSNVAGIVAGVLVPFLVVAVVFAIFYSRKKKPLDSDQNAKAEKSIEKLKEKFIQLQFKSKHTKKIQSLGNRVVIRQALEPSNSGVLWYKNKQQFDGIASCPEQDPARRDPLRLYQGSA